MPFAWKINSRKLLHWNLHIVYISGEKSLRETLVTRCWKAISYLVLIRFLFIYFFFLTPSLISRYLLLSKDMLSQFNTWNSMLILHKTNASLLTNRGGMLKGENNQHGNTLCFVHFWNFNVRISPINKRLISRLHSQREERGMIINDIYDVRISFWNSKCVKLIIL